MTHTIVATGYAPQEDADLMLAVATASCTGHGEGGNDEAAIASDVCRRLTGYTSRDWVPRATRDTTPIPPSYRGVRVRALADGRTLAALHRLGAGERPARFGRDFLVIAEQPTVDRIARAVICLALEEVVAWRSTDRLPDERPGVLELAVDVDIEPRSMLPDGTRLPDHLVRRIADKVAR